MEKSRGKRGKKTDWQLNLGLKETIFAVLGVVVLMLMSFALGALAGRGDIYRVAYSMGMLAPDAAKVAHLPPAAAPPAATPTTPEAVATAAVPVAPGAASAPPAAAAGKAAPSTVVTGNIAEIPGSDAHKKTKTASGGRDPKARQEELRQARQEVVRKLKFQNSFDTAPKSARKDKEKLKPQPTQVRVGQFRDSKAAKAKVAELQKQGVKATVKQSKDQKGALYTVYKPGAICPPGNDSLAQKPEKNRPPAAKPKPE